MGLLVNGVWQEDATRTKDGHFIRPTTRFRNFVTADGRNVAMHLVSNPSHLEAVDPVAVPQ